MSQVSITVLTRGYVNTGKIHYCLIIFILYGSGVIGSAKAIVSEISDDTNQVSTCTCNAYKLWWKLVTVIWMNS